MSDGEIRDWQEFAVALGTLHDQGTEGAHPGVALLCYAANLYLLHRPGRRR